ncbi:MAG: hypothetical protein DMG11_18470 [Acidobacteria bacterium]|nr:MAG: hypothetical protein DMG11_18470 [Acidobacteriota bacterium]
MRLLRWMAVLLLTVLAFAAFGQLYGQRFRNFFSYDDNEFPADTEFVFARWPAAGGTTIPMPRNTSTRS